MERPLVLTLVGLLAACAPEGEVHRSGGESTDSAGVAVWTIPPDERAATFRVERVGGLAFPDSGWTVWPDGVAADRDGGAIYVLDEGTPRILVFDLDGAYRGTLGREGEGPGEYADPTALTVGPDGTLVVVDPGTGSVRRWDTGQSYLGAEPLVPAYWGPGLAASVDALIYTTASGEETGTMVEALVSVVGERVDTLDTVISNWAPLTMPCGRVPVPEVLSPRVVWGARGRLVTWASVPRYELTVADAGRTTTLYRWTRPASSVTREEAEASVATGPLSFLVEACGMTPASVVRGAGWVEEVSPIHLLTVDPAGRVWAARGTAPLVEAVDVFAPEAGYLGTLRDAAFPAVFLDGERYLSVSWSEWGTAVDIWRVVEGEGAAR